MTIAGVRIDKNAKDKEWGFTEASAPRSHRGSDIGVLICHGFGGTPDNMRCLYDRAVSLGFSAVMPKLTGHGETLGRMNEANREDWRRDVGAALDSLRSMGCKRIILSGLSMGALLMADLAEKQAEKGDIAGLIMISPPVRMKRYLRICSAFSGVMPYVLTNETFESLTTEIYCGMATSRLKEIFRLSRAVTKDIDLISVPTLIVEAENDDRVDPVSYDMLTQRLPSAEYCLIRGAKHGITYCPQKYELCDKFEEFLTRIANKEK
ncbi:MAG: alpha/beta fold hydrolase [Clostridiales bacterium]|nr:alpha/beta fold hydrolase [Clostridiales bacterium]